MKNLFRGLHNLFFVMKYPFGRSRNVWSGKYNGFSYTGYDDIPEGGQKAFGKQLSDEIKLAGKKYLKTHKGQKGKDILYGQQIKEKGGELCLYASAVEEIMSVLHRFEKLSTDYCIICGKPATHETSGGIEYLCDDCYKKHSNR